MFRKLTLTLCALMMMCTSVAAETLVVATNCTYPPMEFLNDKKVPNGYSIAYATEVLKRAGYEMELRDVAWDGIFAGLAAGRIDAVIADDPVAKFYANKREDFAGKFSVAYLHKDPEYFGFCVRKGETELVKRINKAIAAMKADGTEDKLKIKWMGSAD